MSSNFNFSQKINYIEEMIRGKIYTLFYNFIYRKIEIKNGFRVGKYFNINFFGNSNLKINESVYFRSFCNLHLEDGELIIGEGTFFNNFCTINCLAKIEIGKDCLFGEGVKIYDHNHKYKDEISIKNQGFSLDYISIGDNCWIGSNVVILKGVKIGNNVVIGANSVIFKDIPSNSIVKAFPPKITKINGDKNEK